MSNMVLGVSSIVGKNYVTIYSDVEDLALDEFHTKVLSYSQHNGPFERNLRLNFNFHIA